MGDCASWSSQTLRRAKQAVTAAPPTRPCARDGVAGRRRRGPRTGGTLSSAVNPPAAPALAGELRTPGKLAAPFVAAKVCMMTLGVGEGAIAGRAGTGVLAAVSLGNASTHGTGLGAMGVILGADPFIRHGYGAGDTRGMAMTRAQRRRRRSTVSSLDGGLQPATHVRCHKRFQVNSACLPF